MRVKKIEFENLNSLKGKWSIDFTHPDYAKNHDIFVICGPTGSGKTTILDAITLALYGRTPRLKAVNDGVAGNEIMTRGTSFCQAKVYYSCKKGDFSSEFSQSMAKSGKLHKAGYIITNVLTGDIVGQSGSGITLAEATSNIIQLDYNQFCRSIMLAQGEFNKFISGTAEDRAAILEKLTGTERYREIAVKIGEKFSDIKNTFNLKKDEKQQKEKLILSEKDESECLARSKGLELFIEELNKKIEKAQVELSFFEQLESLKKRFEASQKEKINLEEKIERFKNDEKRLSLSEKAKKCESDYVFVCEARKNLLKNEDEIKNLQKEIDFATKNFKKASEDEKKVSEMLFYEEKNLAAAQDLWKSVRDLDSKIVSAKKNLSDSKKRKIDAETTYKNSEENLQKLNAALDNIKKNLLESEKYIEQNKIDEHLLEIISKIATLKKSAEEQQAEIKRIDFEKEGLLRDEEENLSLLQKAKQQLSEIEAEILKFVSAQSLLIAKILKSDLAEGSLCPVCGSTYHKNQETEHINLSAKQEIGQKSKNLTEKQEALQKNIQNIEDELKHIDLSLENAEKNLDFAKKSVAKTLAEINTSILPWGKVDKIENLSHIFTELKDRAKLWEEKKGKKEELEKQKGAKEAESSAISKNLATQKNQYENSAAEFEKISEETQKLCAERENLFDSKSVDEEENIEKAKIARFKSEAENARKTKQDCELKKSQFEANRAQIEKAISEQKPKLRDAETQFAEKLHKNDFASEEDFKNARLSEAEYENLLQTRETLKNQKTQAETTLSEAKKALEEYEKNHKVVGTKEETLAQKKEYSAQREKSNAERSELLGRIAANEANKEQYKKIAEDYKKLQEDFATWEQMSKFVGKKDGSDFSNFVQSLTAPTLLRITNKKLMEITKRFKILLRNPLKLEFEVEDIHSDKTGSIENLSGGEKFIVSLAFALGISEFASRNVRVDSLFLDEGFGTLSGEPLEKSIEVLKNLEKQGKMLGIITHVQEVIDKIEQSIRVEPVSCGHSKIEGSGVTNA